MNNEYLDLLFESRNKSYGAYQLRRRAQALTSLALLISVGMILVVALMLQFSNRRNGTVSDQTLKVKHRKVVGYSQLTAPPPIETVSAPPPPSQPRVVKRRPIATKKFLPPVVKPDVEVEEEPIPTQEELKKVNPGLTTTKGDSLGSIQAADLDNVVVEMDMEAEAEVIPEVSEPLPPPPPPPAPKEPRLPAEERNLQNSRKPTRFSGRRGSAASVYCRQHRLS